MQNNRITKARELLLNGDIDSVDYKQIKADADYKIKVSESKLPELGSDYINLKEVEIFLIRRLAT